MSQYMSQEEVSLEPDNEALVWWTRHFGDETKVSVEALTKALATMGKTPSCTEDVVKRVIRGSSHKAVRLGHFQNFVTRFGPLDKAMNHVLEALFDGGSLNVWFHGDLERESAEKLLGTKEGAYIMRYSKKLPSKLILSLVRSGESKHWVITNLPEGFHCEHQLSPTLHGLLNLFSDHLLHPIPSAHLEKRNSRRGSSHESDGTPLSRYTPLSAGSGAGGSGDDDGCGGDGDGCGGEGLYSAITSGEGGGGGDGVNGDGVVGGSQLYASIEDNMAGLAVRDKDKEKDKKKKKDKDKDKDKSKSKSKSKKSKSKSQHDDEGPSLYSEIGAAEPASSLYTPI